MDGFHRRLSRTALSLEVAHMQRPHIRSLSLNPGTSAALPPRSMFRKSSCGMAAVCFSLFFILATPARPQAGAGEWKWVGGSNGVPGPNEGQPGTYGLLQTGDVANIPGGRGADAVWTDHSGNVWHFGGYGFDGIGAVGYLNDLWELNPSTNEWTWMSGSSTVGSAGGQSGVYGQLGSSAGGGVPGGRADPMNWVDSAGNLWLFGGYGFDSVGA
jgi:hypothetical protein